MTSPTSWLDTSPGPGHESSDAQDLALVDRFLRDVRAGRIPEDVLADREDRASIKRALLILADRQDRTEQRLEARP